MNENAKTVAAGYEEKRQKAMENYNSLKQEYDKSRKEASALPEAYSQAFEMLGPLYVAKQIYFFENADSGAKPQFRFASAQEAYREYKDICGFRESAKAPLDMAARMLDMNAAARRLNSYVEMSDYLDSGTLSVKQEDPSVLEMAKDIVHTVPKAMDADMDELRLALIAGMVESLPEKGVCSLAAKGVINKEDLNAISGTIKGEQARKNFMALCKGFGVKQVIALSERMKLRGVSYDNDDGTSRQMALSDLKAYMEQGNEKVRLAVEPYTYTPKLGNPEPAVRVLWGKVCLGNLPREVAIQLDDRYKGLPCTATALSVSGGHEGKPLGIQIELSVLRPVADIAAKPQCRDQGSVISDQENEDGGLPFDMEDDMER